MWKQASDKVLPLRHATLLAVSAITAGALSAIEDESGVPHPCRPQEPRPPPVPVTGSGPATRQPGTVCITRAAASLSCIDQFLAQACDDDTRRQGRPVFRIHSRQRFANLIKRSMLILVDCASRYAGEKFAAQSFTSAAYWASARVRLCPCRFAQFPDPSPTGLLRNASLLIHSQRESSP
jgi:hypothetical protein